MTERSWLQTQIRGLFASINYCVYSLIQWIIQGIFDLANLPSNFTLMEEMRTRIYVILGVFMVFKVTISLLSYMMNPDTMTDKEKGAGKLVVRTITACAFLIVLPFGFTKLREAQEVFIPVLPKLILGQTSDNSNTVQDNAKSMAVAALGAFYRPCDACETEVDVIGDISDMNSTYSDASMREMDTSQLIKTRMVYDYEFNYIFALVVGIIMVLILLGITISVAVRVFKMFLLEMLAPIPIISYIDPKSAKNGAFSAWTKQVLMTFIDIFIKLGLIYLVLYLMSKLASTGADALFDFGGLKKTDPRYLYMMVFLIIGLLIFAKDAPKFVKDALGIKDSGHHGMVEGILGGAAGFAAGAASGAISGRGLSGAITGAVAGASAGYEGGLSGKKSNAWRVGGNAAIQARTGDPNAKSGIMAALSTAASHAQGRRMAAKYGLTEEAIAIGDMDVKSKEAYAQQKEMQYNELINSGAATAAEIARARDEVIAAKTAAAKAASKHKKAEDAYRSFTGKESYKSKYQATRKSAAKDRGYIDTARAIDRKRAASHPGETPGVDYATINDPTKTLDKLYDDVDTRRSLGDAVGSMFKDEVDKKRNDKNYNPYK